MRYTIQTLVDITNTGARRGENLYHYKQEQNYMSLLNSIGLRSNFRVVGLDKDKVDLQGLGFGSKFKSKANVWKWTIEFESLQNHHAFLMRRDLDLVPIFNGLDETVKFPNQCFTTEGKYCNITFSSN